MERRSLGKHFGGEDGVEVYIRFSTLILIAPASFE